MEPHSLARHRRAIAIVAATAILATAAAIAVAIRTTGFVTSQGGGGGSAVDFTKITPIPARAIPSIVHPADVTPSHCQRPEDERESPNLPPLSCRNSGAEPPADAITPADPAMVPTPASIKAGFKIIDNQFFRLTVEVPDSWYSNMRPEGGEFHLFDPAATEANAKHTELNNGIGLHFSASAYVAYAEGVAEVYIQLEKPNTTFGGNPGVIYDKGTAVGERWIRAVFRKGGILYEIDAFVTEGGRPDDQIEADLVTIRGILATVSPY